MKGRIAFYNVMIDPKYNTVMDHMYYCPRCKADWLLWDRKDCSYICKRCHMHFIVVAEVRKPRFDVELHQEARKAVPQSHSKRV